MDDLYETKTIAALEGELSKLANGYGIVSTETVKRIVELRILIDAAKAAAAKHRAKIQLAETGLL